MPGRRPGQVLHIVQTICLAVLLQLPGGFLSAGSDDTDDTSANEDYL